MQAEAALLHTFAFPVHARIGQRAGDEVVDDLVDARLAAQPFVERFFRGVRAGGAVAGGVGLLLVLVLAAAATFELSRLRHSLVRALVRLARAGSGEITIFLFLSAAASNTDRGENHSDREGGHADASLHFNL